MAWTSGDNNCWIAVSFTLHGMLLLQHIGSAESITVSTKPRIYKITTGDLVTSLLVRKPGGNLHTDSG